MRNSARLAIAAVVGTLALVVLPVASADAAQVSHASPNYVICCR